MRFLQSSPLIPGIIVVGTLWFALEARSEDKSKALAAKVAQDSPLTLRDYQADQQERAAALAKRLDRLEDGQKAILDALGKLEKKLEAVEKKLGK